MQALEPLVFRAATRDDVPRIVAMLADDALGARRESFCDPLPEDYYRAFEAVDGDANQELIVAEIGGRAVGTLQLTFLPGLSHRGAWRGQIEAVRVDASVRGSGVGNRLLRWAIDRARQRGCRLVQLTSDKSRADAIRFYEGMGFEATHEGMKLPL